MLSSKSPIRGLKHKIFIKAAFILQFSNVG